MNGLAFGLVLVAFEALCGVDFGVERNGMDGRMGARGEHGDERHGEAQAGGEVAAIERVVGPEAMKTQIHTTPRLRGRIARGSPIMKAGALCARDLSSEVPRDSRYGDITLLR